MSIMTAFVPWGLLMKLWVATIAVALFPVGLAAQEEGGPFGTKMGDNPLSYGCVPHSTKGYFRCDSLPASHPGMDYYIIQAEDGIGTCWVKGMGKDLTTNSRGSAIRTAVDDLADQITVSYGKPETIDYLSRGSIWDEPGDWMMGLLKDERTYAYIWDEGGSYKANVISVFVGASAVRSDTAYAVVEFSYSNLDKCEAALKTRESSVF
jgi:hypothetical protein